MLAQDTVDLYKRNQGLLQRFYRCHAVFHQHFIASVWENVDKSSMDISEMFCLNVKVRHVFLGQNDSFWLWPLGHHVHIYLRDFIRRSGIVLQKKHTSLCSCQNVQLWSYLSIVGYIVPIELWSILSTLKSGRGSILFWAFFDAFGPGRVGIVEESMNVTGECRATQTNIIHWSVVSQKENIFDVRRPIFSLLSK